MKMNSVAKMICPMKQFFSYLGASLAAIAALASCNKEIEAPVEDLKGGVPFEICASTADTKTAIDGFATSWKANDAINLFHAEAGTATYISDDKFTISAENLSANKFKGTLGSSLEDGTSYDWYAIYPYNSIIATPANTGTNGWVTVGGTTQTQEGNDSMAHLCGDACPLYGVATGVASNVVPSIKMKHLTSIIEVNVTNNSGEDLIVTNVTFTGSENIVGTYFINFVETPVAYKASNEKYVSNTASLSVSKGEAIANGSSAKFYIAVKPFTAPSGQTLKVSVNGYSKDIPLTKDVTFTAGKIKKVNFEVDKVVVDYVTLPWSIDGKDGSKVFSSTPGLSASGLGSDYTSHSPYLTKFDGTGDYILIKTDSQIDAVTIGVKMIGGASTSYFDVQGSADGNTFTTVEKLTIKGAQNNTLNLTTTKSFDEKYRYVKLLFTKGSNVGVGPISISKVDNTPALVMNDITNVPATGVSDATASYTMKNAEDDVIISGFSGCVSAASASAGTVTYSVSPNYSSALTTGTIVLVSSSKPELTKTISVSQLKSSLVVSDTEVIIPASSTETTFTVTTPEFGYNTSITVEDGKNLSISSGNSGSYSASAQTITVSSTTSAPTEGSAIVLGTVKIYRNGNTDDVQAKTVTIKKDVVSDKYYQKVSTITSGKSYLIVSNGYVLAHPASTAGTIAGVSVEIVDDKIAQTEKLVSCEFTISDITLSSSTYQTLSFDNSGKKTYVTGASKKTSLGQSTTAPSTASAYTVWKVAKTTVHGSFTITNNGTNNTSRAIRFRTTSDKDYYSFGNYASADGTEYYNVDLYELAE